MNNIVELTLSEVTARVSQHKNVLILLHRSPDADTFGSGIALKILIELLGGRAELLCESEVPHRLEFLAKLAGIKTICSVPEDFTPAMVVAVDVASPSQLGRLEADYSCKTDIIIDHHGKGERFADYFVDPTASAVGEILYNMSETLISEGLISRSDISVSFAQACYAAISSDTGGFKFSNVTPRTHIVASDLVSYGINHAYISKMLFDSKTKAQIMVERETYNRIRFFNGEKIAIVCFPYELIKALGAENEDVKGALELVRSIEGVTVAALLRQTEENGNFRVSIRSSDDTDVAQICAAFGGGGHIRAAGCSISTSNEEKAVSAILESIMNEMGGPRCE